MNVFETLYFVFSHSFHPWITLFVFAVLGLWQGYHALASWGDVLNSELKENASLKNEIARLSKGGKKGVFSIPQTISNGVGRKFKIPFVSIFRGEDDIIEVDHELGIIYSRPPEKIDDLTQLSGVDSAKASRLNESGIYTFKQLASLDETKRANMKRRFGEFNWDEVVAKIVGPQFTYTRPANFTVSQPN